MLLLNVPSAALGQLRIEGRMELGVGHDSNPFYDTDSSILNDRRRGDAFGLFHSLGRAAWTHGRGVTGLEYRGEWNIYRNRNNGADAVHAGRLSTETSLGTGWTIAGFGAYERYTPSAFITDRYRRWHIGSTIMFMPTNRWWLTGQGTLGRRSYPAFTDVRGGTLRDRQVRGGLTLGGFVTTRFSGAATVTGTHNRSDDAVFSYRSVMVNGQVWYDVAPSVSISGQYGIDRRRTAGSVETFRSGRWRWGGIDILYRPSGHLEWTLGMTWYRYQGVGPSQDRIASRQISLSAGWTFGKNVALDGHAVRYTPERTPDGWRIRFHAPAAESVALVGAFNDWDTDRHPLQGPDRRGDWTLVLQLPPGTYQYAFVVDHETWLTPPDASGYIEDAFGNRNGLLTVP